MANKEVEKKIVEFVREYSDQHEFPPSYREISHEIGSVSTTTVYRYIHKMQERGRIEIDRGKPRTARLRRSIMMARGTTQRVRIEASDGGVLRLDLTIDDHMKLSFDGIYDATELKSGVGRIVNCVIEEA